MTIPTPTLEVLQDIKIPDVNGLGTMIALRWWVDSVEFGVSCYSPQQGGDWPGKNDLIATQEVIIQFVKWCNNNG